uniref:Reverse transcriptase domain-containing protein n=1 Tax=Tanacetum cinerariifolium TaxID=118510 RepID=A0A6L2NLA6_TANCI|nr:hypothetical protein [Tanacetum cinerariifolium]
MVEYSQKWYNGTSQLKSTKTYDGLAAIQAQLNNLGRDIKKVNEKVYVAQVGCEQCKGPYYTKDCPLKEEGKTLKEAYYTQFETLSKFTGESAKIHEENSNLIKEIRASTDAAIRNHAATRNQGASIKTLEIQIGKISKVLQERGFGSLPSSPETNPRDHVKSILTIVEADASLICLIRSHEYVVSTGQNRASVSVMPLSTYLNLGIGKFVFLLDFIILDIPEDIKVPLILGRPFLSTAHAKIDVFKRKITLRVGEEKVIFKSVKPTSSLNKRVYMLSLRERMELDLEARPIGETLVLNRSLEPFFRDYIELNDLNLPLKLRRDQVDDLMPTIEEGEVVEEFRARNDARMVSKIFGYPSDYNHDKKIRIDCA